MKPDDEESMKLKELTHCRTAMIAIGEYIPVRVGLSQTLFL